MTPGAGGRRTTGSQEAAAGQRVRLDVSAGSLGQVALIVEQQSDGLRVVIGVENPALAHRVEPERQALEQALKASGMTVQQVRVVQTAELGTILARRISRQRFGNGAEDTNDSTGRGERRSRRLKLIG